MNHWLGIALVAYAFGVLINIITPYPYHFMKKEWKHGAFNKEIDFTRAKLSAKSRRKLWLIRLGSFAVPLYMILEQIVILFWETSHEPPS